MAAKTHYLDKLFNMKIGSLIYQHGCWKQALYTIGYNMHLGGCRQPKENRVANKGFIPSAYPINPQVSTPLFRCSVIHNFLKYGIYR